MNVCKTVEKSILQRLMENVQMQDFRNPKEWGVHRSTPQWRGMRVIPTKSGQMGVLRQSVLRASWTTTWKLQEGGRIMENRREFLKIMRNHTELRAFELVDEVPVLHCRGTAISRGKSCMVWFERCEMFEILQPSAFNLNTWVITISVTSSPNNKVKITWQPS